MAGIDVAQVEEGRPVPQFLQQDAVGAHPQSALQKLLGADLGQPLTVLGVEQVDDVTVGHLQLAGVFDGDQSLVGRDQFD